MRAAGRGRLVGGRWSVIAAPGYLADAGRPVEPVDLARHSGLSHWREASDDLWTMAQTGQFARVRVHGRYHVDNRKP